MFGNNNKKETKSNIIVPQNPSHSLNSIVEGTIIEGDIKSDSDIRIDGKLIGTLDCKGKVIIGPKGSLEGDIRCEHAMIEGNFSGLLSVGDTLTVAKSAKIKGDISTDKLVVHAGAEFNVACSMGQKRSSQKSNAIDVAKNTPKKHLGEEVISFVDNPIQKKN